MRIELDPDDPAQPALLAALPRFNSAESQRRRLLVLMVASASLAAALGLAAVRSEPSIWRILESFNAAALLLLCAGLQSAYWPVRWRARAVGSFVSRIPAWLHLRPVATEPDAPIGEWLWFRQRLQRLSGFLHRRVSIHAMATVCLGVAAYLALLIIRRNWDTSLGGTDLGRAGSVAGGIALLLAFGLLVIERDFARYDEWPEAISLSRIIRVVIATVLLSGVALFFSAADSFWPSRVALLAGLLPAALALEWLIRVAASLFVPRDERSEPTLLAKTVVGGSLSWPPPSLQSIQDNLQARFGIDLRQNWAFAFIRRASLPILAGVAIAGWLATGIAELPPDRRGVYEVFGRPAAVVGPGLHAGLPWPFSRMRPIENGVVHEISTAGPNDAPIAPDTSSADDPAPASYNRLWDASHASDKTLLIASASNHRESFQIVNMDVRLIYRIGLSPQAALDAAYKTSDLPSLIRSTTSRVLVEVFATRTLDGVLGEERIALARMIGAAVQARLDALSSGVEILATVVEAIHPPAGAADAYHSVQAAQISSQATIARERGRAAEQTNLAKQSASAATDAATAAARDRLAAAETLQSRFDAEKLAYRDAGNTFLFEYYLSELSQGLSAGKLIILDHRINDTAAPTIDLRNYGAPLLPR
ncbi:MAG TPA: SPFH domain-containing protein [Steroidobacteraceae bacterium]|nr:SPFH domain-containing protein [Steroidobacteraceae bacterium]HUA26612.1 SPFH domain-containing protein [Steroidobacteraceae bacterium]